MEYQHKLETNKVSNRMSIGGFPIPRDVDANSSTPNYSQELISKFRDGKNTTALPSKESILKEGDTRLEIFNATAAAKMLTSYVSMHLKDEWRKNIFFQLDLIHEFEEWDDELSPIGRDSMTTFLKAMLKVNLKKYPGLGLTNKGYLIAAWTENQKKLTLEFQPKDKVKWIVSQELSPEETERAAGFTNIRRLYRCIAPYGVQSWFTEK